MDAVVYQIVDKAAVVSHVALEKATSCHAWKERSRSLLVLVSVDSPSLLVLLSMVLMVLLSLVVQACLEDTLTSR